MLFIENIAKLFSCTLCCCISCVTIMPAQIVLYNNVADIGNISIHPREIECAIGLSPLIEIFPQFTDRSTIIGAHYLINYKLSDNYMINTKFWHNLKNIHQSLLYGVQIGSSIFFTHKDKLSFSISPQLYVSGNGSDISNYGMKFSSIMEKTITSTFSPRITLSPVIGFGGCDTCRYDVISLSENKSKRWYGVTMNAGCNIKLFSDLGALFEVGISIRQDNFVNQTTTIPVVGLTTYVRL